MSFVLFSGIMSMFILGMVAVFALTARAANGNRMGDEEVLRPDHEAAGIPRFFYRDGAILAPDRRPSAEDLVVDRMERYLRMESARAEEFVSEPSVAKLYQDAERRFQLN